MTTYIAKVVNGNFFEIAKLMNNEFGPAGYELVAVQTVNQFHSVLLLKHTSK